MLVVLRLCEHLILILIDRLRNSLTRLNLNRIFSLQSRDGILILWSFRVTHTRVRVDIDHIDVFTLNWPAFSSNLTDPLPRPGVVPLAPAAFRLRAGFDPFLVIIDQIFQSSLLGFAISKKTIFNRLRPVSSSPSYPFRLFIDQMNRA